MDDLYVLGRGAVCEVCRRSVHHRGLCAWAMPHVLRCQVAWEGAEWVEESPQDVPIPGGAQ